MQSASPGATNICAAKNGRMLERRNFLQTLTATSLGLFFESAAAIPAQTQNDKHTSASETSRFPQGSTVILVHAAWADGSCWSSVILPLERSGLNVICAPIPLTSLTNDTRALNSVLERTSGPVVLAGHAYSGAVIAAVRNHRVKSLVFISALAPDEGETVAKVFYLNPNSPEAPRMIPDEHGFVWLPDDAFHRALAQNASPQQARIAAALQRPIAVACIQEAAPVPAWKTTPSWYLVAEDDRMISPKSQRFMANRMGAKIHAAPVDHTAMYASPQVVVDVILEAARQSLA